MMTPREITGRTVLTGMLAFFGVIFAVNGAFVYFALDTWPGLDVSNAYRKGIEYNKVLSAADAQTTLGWRSRIKILNRAGGRTELHVSIHTQSGEPITGMTVRVEMRRPTHEGIDVHVPLVEDEAGFYTGLTADLLAGQWLGVIHGQGASGEAYMMAHKLTVPQ